jgi:uncharacterized protein YbjT (DUF2867 family)
MKTIVFGATGMVGMGALLECLEDQRVHSVLVVGRRSVGVRHPKLEEIIHQDFFSYESIERRFADCDACFFSLGVSSVGMAAETYYHLTYDLTLAAATSMVRANPGMTFCYVSGEGTDSTEQGRMMWARVKGKTENALLRLPFKAAYMLRPGYIQPLKGVTSRTPLYQTIYVVLGFLYPVLHALLPRYTTTTVDIGRALIRLAIHGDAQHVLTTADINRLAGQA